MLPPADSLTVTPEMLMSGILATMPPHAPSVVYILASRSSASSARTNIGSHGSRWPSGEYEPVLLVPRAVKSCVVVTLPVVDCSVHGPSMYASVQSPPRAHTQPLVSRRSLGAVVSE